MKERRNQMAGTMSGGEQQMCAIGRALMSDPKLLLLDEPSAGLAPVVVQQVFELVKRIRASGLTVLIVEQNVQQVLRVVDRAYLLEAGTIRASGRSERDAGRRHDPASLSRGLGVEARVVEDQVRTMTGYFRHLPAGSRGQRHPARRRAGVAGARAQPDLRRHRRDLDLLRRTGHDRHVRHVLSWSRFSACRITSPRRSRSCWSRRLGRSLHCSSSRRCSRRRRSTSCSPPAACCSSCKASPPSRSASTSAISASACRCWRSARCISAIRGCWLLPRR